MTYLDFFRRTVNKPKIFLSKNEVKFKVSKQWFCTKVWGSEKNHYIPPITYSKTISPWYNMKDNVRQFVNYKKLHMKKGTITTYLLTYQPIYVMRLLKGLLIASALLVISQGHGKNCSTNCFSDIKTNFQGGLINKSIQLFVSLDRWWPKTKH